MSEDSKALKQKGNELFKDKQYEEAAALYSKAIQACPTNEDKEKCVYLKNRAACHIKTQRYKEAVLDCVSALALCPGDVKAMYRYAQGLEGLGKDSEALVQLKKLLAIDPKNKEANEMARRLLAVVKKESDRLQSTDGLVDEMYSTLGNPSASMEIKTQAAKNFGIISREEGGANRIVKSGGLLKLIPYLESESVDLITHIVQTYVGLCTSNKARSCAALQSLTLERVSALVKSPHSTVTSSSVSLLREIILSLNEEDKVTPKDQDSSLPIDPPSLIVPITQMLFLSLLNFEVLPNTRDCILDLFLKTLPVSNMAEVYLKEGLIEQVLSLATHTSETLKEDTEFELDELNSETWLPVSDQCRMNISMVLSHLYDTFSVKDEHKDSREMYKKQCIAFVMALLNKPDSESRLAGLTALATILGANLQIGNEIISDETVLKTAMQIATTNDISCQAIAAEVLTLAASDKSRCEGIIASGLPILKQLYHSSDDRIKVRAMVGLCKVGASSGSNANSAPFAEGATLKLEKTCRRFLVSKKRQSLLKWGAEGIAFLSLDAEVKEALVTDEPALKVLLKLVNSPDKSLLYGIATILVNLTNSYDKPERNPELEELGKYAGQNIPKEHEFDGEEYVKKRVSVLLKTGVVPCLASLSILESKGIREQASRVFLALVIEPGNRGVVVQQGGVKCLLPLATSNNTDIGKLKASQALAKIGITQNPSLAFPGQRLLEVIRPLVRLLKGESGLLQFEGLMALTNLSAMDDSTRQRIYKEGAISTIEGLMFEEHDLIRRAATELMCNMIQLQDVHERFYSDDVERVKLLTLFSGEEDEGLVLAASGALAQLSHDPKICKKILQVKSSKEIFKEMLVRDNDDVKYRAMYVLANLVEAGEEFAREIIEDEFLEIFMAFTQDTFSPKVKAEASRALKKAVEYGLIKPNPDIL